MLVSPEAPQWRRQRPGFQQCLWSALHEQLGPRGPREMKALEAISLLETFVLLAVLHFERFEFKAHQKYFIPFF